MPNSAFPKAITIFFSYDTSAPKDRQMFKKLLAHLSLLKRQHFIDEWYDSAISAGSTIPQLIEQYLDPAHIIVLLVSAEFFASERCYDIEMKRALELYNKGATQLIPVILSPFDGTFSPLEGHTPLPPNGKPVSLWRDREQAFTEVAKGIRWVVEELAKMIGRQSRTPSVKFPFQYIRYRENRFFTDRETILAALSSSFPSNPGNQTTILALNGLGGIGKTQIAREYFKRSSESYEIRLWLNASSRDILSTEVSMLAEKLGLSRTEDEQEQDHFQLLKDWLKEQRTWLLVLDHVDTIELLKEIVPSESKGHVLLTTRTREIGAIASALPIERMSDEASVLFLLQRAGILGREETLEEAPTKLVQQAKELVQTLDGLPLALDQAGAYIEETPCSLDNYLALYEKGKVDLLGKRGKRGEEEHPDSVTITLSLIIEQVSRIRSTNLALLHLLAFLHPEAIPLEMLEYGASALHKPLQTLAANAQKLQEAIGDLETFSLIEYCADRTIVSIHRLVQAVLIGPLSRNQQKKWAIQVVQMVNSVFPEVDFESWIECERYLPQAQHCAVLIDTYKISIIDAALLLERLGSYCYRRGRYSEAEAYLNTALHQHETLQETDFLKMAQTLNALGRLASQRGHYEEAEKQYLRALEIRERELSQDHPKTAESLHNLGMLYINWGEYAQAEQIYERVRSIEEGTIGTEDPDFAKTLNNLALIYYKQARYEQAEAAYQQALTIYERTLSPEDPDLMYPLNGLGAIYEKRGEYEQTEKLYTRALAIGEKALGDNHIETAHNLNILADVYESQGKYTQAEELYQRALSIGEEALGPNHPDVALFLNNLGFLADEQGFYEQAEPLYLRALSIYEQALGKEHDLVASVLDNLGQLYGNREEYERAKTFLRRALLIREQKLGEIHPDTIQSLNNLTELLAAWQEHKEKQARETETTGNGGAN